MRVDPAQLDEFFILSVIRLLKRKLKPVVKGYQPVLVLLSEKLFSLLKMLLHGTVKVKKLFLFAKKPILKMLKVCALLKVFLLHVVV